MKKDNLNHTNTKNPEEMVEFGVGRTSTCPRLRWLQLHEQGLLWKGMNVLDNSSQSVKHQCAYQVHSPKVKVGLELKMWGKNEEFGFEHVGFLTIYRMSRWLSEDFKAEENKWCYSRKSLLILKYPDVRWGGQ